MYVNKYVIVQLFSQKIPTGVVEFAIIHNKSDRRFCGSPNQAGPADLDTDRWVVQYLEYSIQCGPGE